MTLKNTLPIVILLIITLSNSFAFPTTKEKPVRIGIIGLEHDHVNWILGRKDQGDIEIVGIVEPNNALAERYSKRYGFSMKMVYNTIEEMLDKAKPEAVTAFNNIYGHLEVVEKCAPRGIHVMVEKPLAVSVEHAKKMQELALKHKIMLLTNYETTWYGSNHYIYDLAVEKDKLGPIRKIVVHDGHEGPKEIGVSNEFFEWLTDPELNGAGALNDFGCYGANLATWLMEGKRPLSVMAVTQQIKPDIYPKVDDEATIVLTYPEAQIIIQASWNWPFSRKDIEVYGKTGYAIAENGTDMKIRLDGEKNFTQVKAPSRNTPNNDPFALLSHLVRNGYNLPANDLTSLENNMMVVEILEAAKESARTGKDVILKK
ncbi:MAG: Gfo/Idh/MocA family oxidoreductase [Cyclobacteriaceae bacterium]|nr:Gfo/Idh/MocA family oxidoreductase [Cyclobacteriaceae bacterium]